MKVHHIGIKVSTIKDSRHFYEVLGFIPVGEEIEDYYQHNVLLFMRLGNTLIELIQPMDKTSSIYKSRLGIHHLCYEVNNMDVLIQNMERKHLWKKIYDGVAPAINNRRIVFVINKELLLIELLEC